MTQEIDNKKPNWFVRILIILLCIFIGGLIYFNFFWTCPPAQISGGLLVLVAFLTVLVLSEALAYVKANYSILDIAELVKNAKKLITETAGVELDYFTIADGETLLPIQNKQVINPVALVAAKVGETRLIDNILLN